MCGNVSGDFKVKPLLVYHSHSPQVFKWSNVMKNKLSVMWRANANAWVIQQCFNKFVAQSVKTYL